jgi:hypothetical protein
VEPKRVLPDAKRPPPGWMGAVFGHAIAYKALALAMASAAALAAASMLVRAAVSEADSLSSAEMTVRMTGSACHVRAALQ